jgi:hypothetical protein
MFIANVNAAQRGVTLRGKPPTPLWLRVPMQILFIALLWWSTRVQTALRIVSADSEKFLICTQYLLTTQSVFKLSKSFPTIRVEMGVDV